MPGDPAPPRAARAAAAGPLDPASGELDLGHLASLIDERTKLVCCTGASNFLGTKNPLPTIRALAHASGYHQPHGEQRSLLLVDGAQLVPGSPIDFTGLDVDRSSPTSSTRP